MPKSQMPKSQIPNPKLQLVSFAEIPNPKYYSGRGNKEGCEAEAEEGRKAEAEEGRKAEAEEGREAEAEEGREEEAREYEEMREGNVTKNANKKIEINNNVMETNKNTCSII
ncbi:hypothetical protein Glove_360g104 [Diversispora epigaea]|uniref:Uncharacterized protein n=1 Tax=Diversispora epigaea TaxID=1348612 RepID=A0A397HE35_9GLOM|nr:hypothetical protein Glove_360g104 [Diversispora epigaea]